MTDSLQMSSNQFLAPRAEATRNLHTLTSWMTSSPTTTPIWTYTTKGLTAIMLLRLSRKNGTYHWEGRSSSCVPIFSFMVLSRAAKERSGQAHISGHVATSVTAYPVTCSRWGAIFCTSICTPPNLDSRL